MIFPLLLSLLSALTHFAFFGWPAAVVFDEVYMGSFVSAYSTHAYYFDIHPPLAKLITHFIGTFIGAPSNVDFSNIGNVLPWGIIWLRLLPLIAGIFLPVIIYYICRQLNFSKLISFAAGMFIILENSILAQSRFLLFDSLMLLFGFSSILLYLIYVKKGTKLSRAHCLTILVGSAILAAGAFSIKWTGFAFPLTIVIAEIMRIKEWKKLLKFFSIYATIGLVIYMSAFAIHFAYLDHTGPGDAFMTDRFQKTLEGSVASTNAEIKPKGYFGKFIELNHEMYEANKTLTATHQYGSKWYTWPLMLRTVFYWQGKTTEAGSAYIYLIGNPLIYWFGTLSIICLFLFTVKKINRPLLPLRTWRMTLKKEGVPLFIIIGFLVNFLPFVLIGRVMFLYHYEAALVFSIIAIAYLLEKFIPDKKKPFTIFVILSICFLSFAYFSPLTYGTHLTESALNAHMWINTWR